MATFCSAEAAIAAIARGELVVVVDDDDRENEGDLIGCAELATAEKLAFVVRYSSGIVCVPAPAARLEALELEALESEYRDPNCTAFCMPVDFRHGTTTGVSAADRAATVVAMASPNAVPSDFFRPGHVFPLRAVSGGVLERRGHTEACVDLCALAGCGAAVGYIAEMCNDDGTMSRLPELRVFCAAHDLLLLKIDTLAAYRRAALAASATPTVQLSLTSSRGVAVASTRGRVRDVVSAVAYGATAAGAALRGASLAFFNGAFSPPTLAHAHIASSVAAMASVDVLWLDAEPATQHKQRFMDETFDARVAMCERMVRSLDLRACAGVGTLRRDLGALGHGEELFDALRALVGPEGHLFWVLGADVVEGMRYWPEKARRFLRPRRTCDGIIVFVRAGWTEISVRALLADVLGVGAPRTGAAEGGDRSGAAALAGTSFVSALHFFSFRYSLTHSFFFYRRSMYAFHAFVVHVVPMPEALAGTSSHLARAALATPGAAAEATSVDGIMLPSVAALCREHTPDVMDIYAAQVSPPTPPADGSDCRLQEPPGPVGTSDTERTEQAVTGRTGTGNPYDSQRPSRVTAPP